MPEHIITSVDQLRLLKPSPAPHSESQLGALLVKSGIITREQLGRIIEEKQRLGESFLDTMTALGYLHGENELAVLSSRLGIPRVRIAEMEIPRDVLASIPRELIVKYQVFPLGVVDSKLVVAMTNPCNIEALQAIGFISEHVVELVIAPGDDIHTLMDRYLFSSAEDELLTELNDSLGTGSRAQEITAAALQERAQQRPVVKFVDSLLHRAVALGASDINIRPTDAGGDIYYRIDGRMLLQRSLDLRQIAPIIARVKIMSGMNIAEHRLPQDGHTMYEEGQQRIDFRVSAIPMVNGESVVIRILDKSKGLINLDALGLEEQEIQRMREILSHNFGIFLVTGPTGSGKTTTLYAVVNERRARGPHIITVEDPVEYRLDGVEQIQIRPKIGYTFAEALRHILRHDPDEILIGEMRDYETAEIAVKAALTGHFVMSTLHTNDAPSTITRLVDMGIEPYLINSTVVGVLAQRLARKICEHCKQPDPDDSRLKEFFNLAPETETWMGRGCVECHNTGYRGRLMVGELLTMTSPLKALVSRNANADQLREQAQADGMTPLTRNAVQLALEGKTSLEEVFRVRLE